VGYSIQQLNNTSLVYKKPWEEGLRKKKIFTVVFYPIKIRRQTGKERGDLPAKPIKSKFCCLDVNLHIQGSVNVS